MPKHIAIIMDGNGRWAKERGLERSEGHRKGLDVVHEITDAAAEVGVQYLTLYAFSTENWNRPQAEVDALMALVVFGIERETPGMVEKGVRLSVIGDLDRLPSDVKARLLNCIRDTSGAQEVQKGRLSVDDITETTVDEFMTTVSMPNPDLLIRTGGEIRLSNFLLWQLSYAEFYFTEEYWPDFTGESLYRAIVEYQARERRFGKTSEQL